MNRIAIYMCNMGNAIIGGKDQVIYNLIKGFQENGQAQAFFCICHKNIEERIRRISPDIGIITVPSFKRKWLKLKWSATLRDMAIQYQLRKNKIDIMLISSKFATDRKYSVKTAEIPHDVQAFERIKDHPEMYINNAEDEKDAAEKDAEKLLKEFRKRDYIVAISQYDKGKMREYLPWLQGRIKQIYNPIVFPEYEERNEALVEFITALNIQFRHKNIETLIYAFDRIKARTDFNLMLIGRDKSQYVKGLKELVNQLGLKDRVIFSGYVSYEEMHRIMARTAFYVSPSYFEGFGMSSIEMMAAGVPSIIADNSAQREVTQDLCRYYSPADDIEALKEAMLAEIENPASKIRLEEISNIIRKKYDYRDRARPYFEFLQSI